jgi:hypothetical protein
MGFITGSIHFRRRRVLPLAKQAQREVDDEDHRFSVACTTQSAGVYYLKQ